MKHAVLICLSIGAPVFAETCPPVADHSQALAGHIRDLQNAPFPADAQRINNQMWQLWTDAPDDKAQALLDQGMSQRSSYDLLGSRDTLDQLVEYCPHYAEGYNQRAFSNYLRQDFAAALVDLERALEITPNHVAALAGKGLTLIGLGRDAEAQEALKAAVALNPWLNERALITEPDGTDI